MTQTAGTIQIAPESRPSTPSWMGEVAVVAQVLKHTGLLKAIQERVRFARARFGTYDTIDFVVVLLGSALSGERTLTASYTRLLPFADAFMALFERKCLPDRSTRSRFLAALDTATVEALRTLFLADLVTRTPFPSPGGLSDRLGKQWWLVDVDGTKHAARQRALPPPAERPPCPSSSARPGLRSRLHGMQAGGSRENADHRLTALDASMDRHLLRRGQWEISGGMETCVAGEYLVCAGFVSSSFPGRDP